MRRRSTGTNGRAPSGGLRRRRWTLDRGSAGTATGPVRRESVLRRVSVDRALSVPPGRQLERQLAVMVREGRLEPGRRLPSTRRLARVVGLHRNTVAAAYRRLAGRGLLELRHGARARVLPLVAPPWDGGTGRVVAAAADAGTARLMAAEIRDALAPEIEVEPLVADRVTRVEAGDEAAEGQLVAALPGRALHRSTPGSGAGYVERGGGVLPVHQDRRTGVREALLRAPPLAGVAVATRCPLLREAVASDAARLRGEELSLRIFPGRSPRRSFEGAPRGAGADLLIADRLAPGPSCGGSPSPSAPAVARARLLSRESLAAVAGGAGGTGSEVVRARGARDAQAGR